MSEPSAPGAEYDAVRGALRERGYLQGPIQRFLFRDLLRSPDGLVRLPRTALKAALLGAPLLAGVLALAAAVANRPLRGVLDGLLLWLWFLPAAAIALFIVDLAAALIVVTLARARGARAGDSLAAGLLAALPVTGYLLALWWIHPPEAGMAFDAGYLALAAALAVPLAWLAGLVALAGIAGRTRQVPRRIGLRAWAAVAVVSIAAAAAMGALGARDGRSAATPPPSFEPADGAPLLWIGIDGLDGRTLEAFEPRGAVGQLLDLMARGATYPLAPRPDAEPAEVWTTLTTGMPPERHGVRSVGVERLPGVATPLRHRSGSLSLGAALRWVLPTRTEPAGAAVRRVRTVWEIVALRRPAVAVGWWGSWPAAVAGGDEAARYVVSDRVLPKLLAGAAGDRDTAPAALFERLAADFPGDREKLRRSFETAFAGVGNDEVARWAWESYLIDAWNWRVTERLAADGTVRGIFVYLPGLDILRHRLGRGRQGGLSALLDQQAAIEAYVRCLDGLIAEAEELREARSADLLLIADPGRTAVPGAEGFVVAAGPGVRAACIGPAASRLDAVPLALALMGYPASAEMPGAPPRACLDDVAPVTTVAGYGSRPPLEGPAESAWDDEMLDRLRSLGYLN